MIATFHISFYEPWQGALMRGEVERFVKDITEAYKMRDSYAEYYQNKYGSATIVLYTIKN